MGSYSVPTVWSWHFLSVFLILLKWRGNFLKVSAEKQMGLIWFNTSIQLLLGKLAEIFIWKKNSIV